MRNIHKYRVLAGPDAVLRTTNERPDAVQYILGVLRQSDPNIGDVRLQEWDWHQFDYRTVHNFGPPGQPAKTNARFWIYSSNQGEGWVKITLKPGQSIELYGGGPHEEGYTHWCEQYEHDEYEHGVICRRTVNSLDCDGRLDQYCDTISHLDELRARDMVEAWQDWDHQFNRLVTRPENIGILAPAWTELARSQRDHAAEAMGY